MFAGRIVASDDEAAVIVPSAALSQEFKQTFRIEWMRQTGECVNVVPAALKAAAIAFFAHHYFATLYLHWPVRFEREHDFVPKFTLDGEDVFEHAKQPELLRRNPQLFHDLPACGVNRPLAWFDATAHWAVEQPPLDGVLG